MNKTMPAYYGTVRNRTMLSTPSKHGSIRIDELDRIPRLPRKESRCDDTRVETGRLDTPIRLESHKASSACVDVAIAMTSSRVLSYGWRFALDVGAIS